MSFDVDVTKRLGDSEIYEFLFLPGFTLRDEVTEIQCCTRLK